MDLALLLRHQLKIVGMADKIERGLRGSKQLFYLAVRQVVKIGEN